MRAGKELVGTHWPQIEEAQIMEGGPQERQFFLRDRPLFLEEIT